MAKISLLPQTVEYALRLIVVLAGRRHHQATAQELAASAGVSGPYLYRVIGRLTRAGLIRSRPGPGGGYQLAREPAEITMLDVVSAMGELQRIERCPLGLEEDRDELCPLHRELARLTEQIEATFARITIDQLVRGSGRAPLCTGVSCDDTAR